jgi:extradiol dioxygenase family protein
MPPTFHLSLSVSDLGVTLDFYRRLLKAEPGRTTPHWIDLWLLGAQVTVYERPAAVVPSPFREAQHFGATVDWTDWPEWEARLGQSGAVVQRVHDPDRGVAKLVVRDPDGYLVELKAYRDPQVLMQPET